MINNIAKIHGEIIDELIEQKKVKPNLIFSVRRTNNKNRLDKGYWFIGNDNYLCLSFWNGDDPVEKIYNICFVVLVNKLSYFELSTHDIENKLPFINKIIDNFDGFEKIGNKNKWRIHFSGTDYISNLRIFITDYKPVIDKLLALHKPKGINFFTSDYESNYTNDRIQLRELQIEFGKKNKVARICWNTGNWKYPTGPEGKSVSNDSYENRVGFGHEEWLFDNARIIDGYHYAFLQQFGKGSNHIGQKYNIALYTISSSKKRYYVGKINDVECISFNEAEKVYIQYKSNGWLKEMKQEVEVSGGNIKALENTSSNDYFNIRFKFENCDLPDELILLDESDVNISTPRYSLLTQKADFSYKETVQETRNIGHRGVFSKNTDVVKVTYNRDIEYNPRHNKMQNDICEILKQSSEYMASSVIMEEGWVDIKATTLNGENHYFEVKTSSAKLSIRQAIGQVMEYAYFPNSNNADKLFIISDAKPDDKIKLYLQHIRHSFHLPIYYKQYDSTRKKLLEVY